LGGGTERGFRGAEGPLHLLRRRRNGKNPKVKKFSAKTRWRSLRFVFLLKSGKIERPERAIVYEAEFVAVDIETEGK